MASPKIRGVPFIMEVISRTLPSKVLDIGIGFGKIGYLLRYNFELWQTGDKFTIQIDGIEAYEPIITPLQRSIYNTIHIGDALSVIDNISVYYDTVLMIDLLQYMSKAQGLELMFKCINKTDNIVVVIPLSRERLNNHATFENPFEKQLTEWLTSDIEGFAESNNLRCLEFIDSDNKIFIIKRG